jgi:hypothetical protein
MTSTLATPKDVVSGVDTGNLVGEIHARILYSYLQKRE